MPNRSKEKGDRRERQIVKKLNEIKGVHAQRVPLSGAAGGKFASDIDITYDYGLDRMKAEVKAREDGAGFKTIEKWLGTNDLLFLVQDNKKDPLVVMPWSVLETIFSTEAFYDDSVPDPDNDETFVVRLEGASVPASVGSEEIDQEGDCDRHGDGTGERGPNPSDSPGNGFGW